METPTGNTWAQQGGPGPGPSPPSGENRPQIQVQSMGNYTPNHTLPQVPPMQMPTSAPIPLQHHGHFYGASQSSSNPLSTLGGVSQASPRQVPPPAAPPQRLTPPPVPPQPALPPANSQPRPPYSLPTIGQAIQNADRERQYHDAEMREAEDRLQQEREYREQQRMNDQQRSPPSAHAGSLPLQQPIASRAPAILHGPNGLLNANAGMSGPAAPSGAPGALYANGLPAPEPGVRPFAASTLPVLSNQAGILSAPTHPADASPSSVPSGVVNAASAVPQGQQPILNDALSYLDLVKVRFQEQPDVYNKFLDIMKDFKSQAIDTPGVIERVSTLFHGHPQLIEGFNTFLPPGYRIEAGWDNDPNRIRVTTPMGTTTCRPSMISSQLAQRSLGGAGDGSYPPAQQTGLDQYRASEPGWHSSAPRDGNMEGPYSPNARPGPGAAYSQQTPSRQTVLPSYAARDEIQPADAAALVHQQEQRGVSQLQNAVNVAVDNQAGRVPSMHSVPIDGGAGMIVRQGVNAAGMTMPANSQASVEKRGPIEFNHAINYVNKIKVRFAQQPEVYKQFLEILQTYQRESKPIQDVYAQVTELFTTAPDLLEDFKQFLPESAAHAKSQAMALHGDDMVATSNVRGEASYVSGMPRMSQTPKPEKMPPLGNFPPPSSVKDNTKKRRAGGASVGVLGGAAMAAQDAGPTRGNGQGPHAAKRQKLTGGKTAMNEVAIPSPSLVPELPTPLPPSAMGGAPDELAWFERAKKFIGNRQSYNEFLKLCNLFSQEIIDGNTLIHKADAFIGQNTDLMNFFKDFVHYQSADEVIENRPVQSSTKVVLANCRALGPSYRLLPKRERYAKCSGRDEMCHQVLNDEWASHPTWASEESGFISHRKNMYEEALYRMEEERHDYDFNIETCLRTIQLLEPIVAQINAMDPEDRQHYRLPLGLGGQSEAIWQRVIKKLYDRPMGCKVVNDMCERPTRICPVILDRLKEKAEKWKQAQREWEKVWRDQTHKQFWKSLDHQGLNAKSENKRSYQPKALHTEIQARWQEQQRQKQIKPSARILNYQLDVAFGDAEVIQDTCHMLLVYLQKYYQGGDQTKIEAFLKNFLATFFELDKDAFAARMSDIYVRTPPNEEEEEPAANDETPSRGRRNANGKKNLLRGVLDPGKQGKKDVKEESKESTPEITSMDEDSSTQTDGQSDQNTKLDASESRWMEHPVSGNSRDRQHIKFNEPFQRHAFSLYANLHIYCFMRMFAMLYERLSNLKALEIVVHDDVRRALAPKPAADLQIADRNLAVYFNDTSPTANYYRQMIKLFETSVDNSNNDKNTNDNSNKMARIEDTLRRFYLPSGWQLYSFDKMLAATVKFASQVIVNDAKDRSQDIVNLFFSNRKEVQTTHQIEIDYRKQVEKLAKDGDVYRIIFDADAQHVTFRILKKEDKTFGTTGMPADVNWSYYVTAYAMRDWTEGVTRDIRWPFLRRSVLRELDAVTDTDVNPTFVPAHADEGLTVRIAPNNYRLLWERGTADWWVHNPRRRARRAHRAVALAGERRARFEAKLLETPKWADGLSAEEVQRAKATFELDGEAEAEAEA